MVMGEKNEEYRKLKLPYFAMSNVFPYILCTHIFGPNFQGKKTFHFNFLIQFSIYLYLYTCSLYYKGILSFNFEHIMVQETLWNK